MTKGMFTLRQVLSKRSCSPLICKRTVVFPVHPFRVHCVGYTGNHIECPVVFNGSKTYLAGCIATFSHLVILLMKYSERCTIKSQHRKWVIWRSALTSSSEGWLVALLCILNLRFLRDATQYRASSSWGIWAGYMCSSFTNYVQWDFDTQSLKSFTYIHDQIIVTILLYDLNQRNIINII